MLRNFTPLFLILFLLLTPYKSFALDIEKKDVAKYGAWTVTLNYQNLSNPTCQIWSNALSKEMDYFGMITIWRDYKTSEKLADRIYIEVSVLETEGPKFVALEKNPVHGFGNETGFLRGIPRTQDGMILFAVDKDNFKRLIAPSNNFFLAIAKDQDGRKIAIGTTLEGIQEACTQCGMFD